MTLSRHFWLENWEKDLIPILRPLSSMTEEEKQVIENMAKIYKGYMTLPSYEISKRWAADQTRYLLSLHFDLFNLIPEGLALDKNSLK